MLTPDLLAYVKSCLPRSPARILEVGAGRGELANELRAAGYEVTAIDPVAEPGTGVQRLSLLDVSGRFEAAVAVVSLHHVEPLEESCAHLASLMPPGARLVVDEFDLARCDEHAIGWCVTQRRALGIHGPGEEPAQILRRLREHIRPLEDVSAALRRHFELGEPVRGPYLHRWELHPSLQGLEVELIARGRLPATGARLIAIRRG